MYQINPDIIFRSINDSMIIITPWNNRLHTASSTGAVIVQGLIDQKSEQSILECIVEQFDISLDKAERDLRTFIDKLIEQKIFYKEGL